MEVKIPRQIKIEYDDQLDLEKINKLVLELFKETKNSRIKKIKNKISQLKAQETKTNVERETLEEKLEKLKQSKLEIKKGKDRRKYSERIDPIIEMYNNLENSEESNTSESSRDVSTARKKAIGEFIDILEDYIDVEINRGGKTVSEEYSVESKSKTVCEDMDRKNFFKAFQEIQGKLNIKIPDDLLKKLDKHMKSYGLPTRMDAKNIPLSKDGKKKGTDRKIMREALKRTTNQRYYSMINIICSIYWGWKLPDLGSIESKVMRDYDATQKIFKSMKLGRSNLGVQFRLYKHLEQYKDEIEELGYKLNKKDFEIVGTRNIILEYEEIWKAMAKGAGLLPIDTI